LIEYLEGAHSGDFMTGLQEEVEENLEHMIADSNYRDPTTTLPVAPPAVTCKCNSGKCGHCGVLNKWWTSFRQTVDDLLLKSNIHRCTTNRNKDGSQNKSRSFTGCLDNIYGKCKARFPRELVQKTYIDEETGHIHLKKNAQWINTFTHLVTYLFHCNTDVTSLKSGTAIRGVLLYVTNYITKPALKTSVIFDTIRSVFQKNLDLVSGSVDQQQLARKLMTKIVNSLSVKMEHGSPVINMYLLGNPDHYCSHNFSHCYWQAFVTNARAPWVSSTLADENNQHRNKPVQVSILKQGRQVVGLSPVMDYIWRPHELETLTLYDWLGNCVRERKKNSGKRMGANQSNPDPPQVSDDEDEHMVGELVESGNLLLFASEHPLEATHGVRWLSKKNKRVPNLIGPSLPRPDQGDRDYYCSTMLTLFKPWRTGHDLRADMDTWEEAFDKHSFSQCNRTLMQNANIRYECLDSLDDFHAQMKKGTVTMPKWADDKTVLQEFDQINTEEYMGVDNGETAWDGMLVAEATGNRENAEKDLKASMK
jgi:hypothetical protein